MSVRPRPPVVHLCAQAACQNGSSAVSLINLSLVPGLFVCNVRDGLFARIIVYMFVDYCNLSCEHYVWWLSVSFIWVSPVCICGLTDTVFIFRTGCSHPLCDKVLISV